MTNRFVYVVTTEFDDASVAADYEAWLIDGHLRDVVEAGALEASAVRKAGERLCCEARYVFADAAAFARYEREEAPRLRAEGAAKFPPGRGVRMQRSTGTELLSVEKHS